VNWEFAMARHRGIRIGPLPWVAAPRPAGMPAVRRLAARRPGPARLTDSAGRRLPCDLDP